MNWLLPEHTADALPLEAERIERLRRRVLDCFRGHGYELVMPPLIEYLDSLLTGAGQDLRLRTFKLVDQLSGRTLGVRADMTTQVARIDAHLLNRQGVARLCYCDSVLHTLPASISASREPIQIGAELYGHAGIAADVEIVRLMSEALAACGVPALQIDIGHVGVLRALSEAAGLAADDVGVVLELLQAKDVPALTEFAARLPAPWCAALCQLPRLYGGIEVLAEARQRLPALPGIEAALAEVEALSAAVVEGMLSIDLADPRGYHYHNGLVFAAYGAGAPAAIARGGRYDGVGAAFGRSRPATGFSMDLRELVRLLPAEAAPGAILAPAWLLALEEGSEGGEGSDAAALRNRDLAAHIAGLRQAGEVVVQALPGETECEGPRCDRRLAWSGGHWQIEAINQE